MARESDADGPEPRATVPDLAWWSEFIQRRDYLDELADDLETNLAANKAALPTHDHDADLSRMRARIAEADEMIATWRGSRMAIEGD